MSRINLITSLKISVDDICIADLEFKQLLCLLQKREKKTVTEMFSKNIDK